jgi:uncharacterized protein YjbJ (UPF0337 family)
MKDFSLRMVAEGWLSGRGFALLRGREAGGFVIEKLVSGQERQRRREADVAVPPLHSFPLTYKEVIMANEDIAAGKVKQLKGKANDVMGAAKGDTAQQIKGKIQKGVGKVQESLGKADKEMNRKNPG